MKTYSRKGGTTTSLKSNLKSVHATEYEEFIKLETEKKDTVQPSTSTPLQDAKKQITLKETLLKNTKWCTSNAKSKEVDRLISEMIALQEFNFVRYRISTTYAVYCAKLSVKGNTIFYGKYLRMLMEWGIIKEKIHCFVRDSGSNMIREMKLGDLPDVSCTVHQLQICVRTFLIIEMQKISTHFNHSQIAQTELHKIQKEQLNQECLSVKQDCSTQWNSTFYMLERTIKIQDSLCLYACKHNISQLSPEEWLQLKKIVTIIQPFEEITQNMSDNNASISSVIPLIHTLKYALQTEASKQDTNEKFKSIIKCTVDQLNSKFDPRYKTKIFNEVVEEKIETEIMSLFDAVADTSKNEADNIGAPVEKRARMELPAEASHSNVQTVLSNILLSSDSDEDDDDTSGRYAVLDKFVVMKSMLNEYNKEKRISISDDPLLWWKVNGNTKFQPLQSIARQYLSCPPGSVASEQLFSGAGLIYDSLRNRLDGDKASKLLFIKIHYLWSPF
ncbi:hypothetical protein HW555_011307 [Spodoptera exigua]|uniref:HAT C-terminal dimerisation domain-containing protein n=1 Tax=Spodoptera exigua TaxID=7107 RepID=A0A835L034_SPOEX|nr:hypothetical protein HW555_011307 [Spodoptera exigua]